MKKIIVAVVLIVAAGIAAPWAVGALTEQRWSQTEANLNSQQPMVQIETRSYDRGYASAKVEGMLRLQLPGADERIMLPYEGQVSHGLTSSTIDFDFGAGDSEIVQQLFPDQRPTLTATVNAWGTIDVDLMIPAMMIEDDTVEGSLSVSKLEARLGVSDDGNQVEVSVTWPGMVATDAEASFTLEDVELNQSMSRLDGDVWIGDGTLSIEYVVARLADAPEVVFTNLDLESATTAGDNDKRFTVESRLNIEKAGAGDHASGPFLTRFAMRDVNVAAWNALLANVTELQMLNSTQVAGLSRQAMMEQQMQAMDAVTKSLKTLVFSGISFGFPEISLKFAEGSFIGDAMFSHPELEASAVNGQTLIMEQLTGEANLRIPTSLVEVQPTLQQQVAPLLQQGLLVEDGDDLVLEARMEDLAVDINGNVMPLPPVM
jgi:uncharacterized protein YdgA (DUF945 family)